MFAYIISVMVVCSSNIHFSRRLHVARLFSKTLLENDFRHLWTSLRLKSGWWFGTFFHILGIIIPTDFHIFRGVETTTDRSEHNVSVLAASWRHLSCCGAKMKPWLPEATPGERMIKIYHIIYSFTGILRYRMV